MDENGSAKKSSPSPTKSKRRLQLCSLLALRKGRVGCLPAANSDDSGDNDESKCRTEEPWFQWRDGTMESSEVQNCETKRGDLNKCDSSTNVALCCAITESSRTPVHFHSEFRSSGEKSESGNVYRRSVLTRINGTTRSDESKDQRLQDSEGNGMSKPLSELNLASTKKCNTKKGFFCKNKSAHKRSFSLSKSVFYTGDNKYSGDNKTFKAETMQNMETRQLDDASPVSSSSPVESCIVPLRRAEMLVQRRSTDNTKASSSGGSSPGSERSIVMDERETIKRSKRRSRPSSIAVMATSNSDEQQQSCSSRDGSTDNLARQSLLAAQVLHLIPTTKARERNYLHGRSAANSLLGTVELERVLPQRDVRIYVGTWNMNGEEPPSQLNALLLPEGLEHVPDLLCIGTQESYPERFEWEVGLQETIGPSHVLLHSAVLGTLHLAIYVRRDLIWFCSEPEDDSFSVRTGSAFRTKGAVAIGLSLFGTTLLFVTAHLTAHQDKVKERVHDVKRIIKELELPKALQVKRKSKDVTQNYDYTFWCGDLNFRLNEPRNQVVEWVAQQAFPLNELMPSDATLSDQLTNIINEGSVFRGFEEGPLTFAPTYKYDPGTHTFDTSHKQRTPSYTDRILFKCRRSSSGGGGERMECLAYTSVPSVCTSDHKPVWGLYKCPVRPGIDTIPLNAGLFNRDVYLEAIKRRAVAMDDDDASPPVCVLQ